VRAEREVKREGERLEKGKRNANSSRFSESSSNNRSMKKFEKVKMGNGWTARAWEEEGETRPERAPEDSGFRESGHRELVKDGGRGRNQHKSICWRSRG